jgi:hypothetical protein
LPRELRGYGAPMGGAPSSSPLIPVKTAHLPAFAGMSGNGATPPALSNAGIWARAGPTAA